MSTLYISDLDGTLLDSTGNLTPTSKNLLTELMQQGIHFTCATARTSATVSKILDSVPLSIPAILMNGVVILDFTTNHYVKVEHLHQDFYSLLLDALTDYNLKAFIYAIEGDELNTYYHEFSNQAMYAFFNERITHYQKRYTKVASLSEISKENVIYSLLLDKKENLEPLCDWLQSMKKIYPVDYTFYPEIYYEDTWCLEIFSHNASKYNAVQFLRQTYHYDKIIGFGDNLNDLSLFAACDECYAVANAKDPVKKAATAVIGSNTEDSVPKKIFSLENAFPR